MNIDIVMAIATALILLFGVLNGYRRGALRETAALVGILLGALLVEYWAPRWSAWLAGRGFDAATARLASEIVLIGAPTLGGYGVGLLLPRPRSRAERGYGAGIGLLNFALLGALGVRSWQRFGWGEQSALQPVASWLRTALVTRYALDYFDLALLALAGALVLVALGAVVARLVRLLTRRGPATPARPAPRPTQPVPTVSPTPGAPPAQQPTQPQHVPPGQQEKFLE